MSFRSFKHWVQAGAGALGDRPIDRLSIVGVDRGCFEGLNDVNNDKKGPEMNND